MYGLAVWMHNSPIVPPDLGQKAKRPVCPCPLAQTLSGVPLGHGEPWEEEAGLETLTLWPQVVRLPLEGPPGWYWVLRQLGALDLLGREAEALLGQEPWSPGVEAERCPHHTAGRADMRLTPEEDTDPFTVDVFCFSHVLGSALPHALWAEVCVPCSWGCDVCNRSWAQAP